METIEIRPMEAEDYDKVQKLWMSIRGFGIRSIDDSREDIERFLKRNPTTSVVACAGDRIVGSILCGHDGRQASFYHVCVKKSWRRQGIGTRMVVYCMNVLRELKINKINPRLPRMTAATPSGNRSAGHAGQIAIIMSLFSTRRILQDL